MPTGAASASTWLAARQPVMRRIPATDMRLDDRASCLGDALTTPDAQREVALRVMAIGGGPSPGQRYRSR